MEKEKAVDEMEKERERVEERDEGGKKEMRRGKGRKK